MFFVASKAKIEKRTMEKRANLLNSKYGGEENYYTRVLEEFLPQHLYLNWGFVYLVFRYILAEHIIHFTETGNKED